MKKTWLVLGVVAAGGGATLWWSLRDADLPVVSFTAVEQETLVSTLPSNGKVEPLEWQAVRAEAGGLVDRVPAREGAQIGSGAVVAVLRFSDAEAALTTAEAQAERARADLAVIDKGGKAQELADLDNQFDRAKFDRDQAVKESEALERLLAKNAVTRVEVEAQRRKVDSAELEMKSLERRRAALVTTGERVVAQARLREAQAAAEVARKRLAMAEIRSPMAGVVYNLTARPGTYLEPGDPVANVGRVERLRVRVYVDEPELGRVTAGLPVRITWDALPGQEWNGVVERLPTEITSLGTRQVGEVLCTIENPGGRLVPGTNINAEIRAAVVAGALLLPKEAVRREGNETGILLLVRGEGRATVRWRKIRLGISSATHAQIAEGLSAGDWAALPTERVLRDGDRVKAILPQERKR